MYTYTEKRYLTKSMWCLAIIHICAHSKNMGINKELVPLFLLEEEQGDQLCVNAHLLTTSTLLGRHALDLGA